MIDSTCGTLNGRVCAGQNLQFAVIVDLMLERPVRLRYFSPHMILESGWCRWWDSHKSAEFLLLNYYRPTTRNELLHN